MKKYLKRLYHIIPFEKNLFLMIRRIFKPGRNISKHLHFKGVINVPVKENKSFQIKHYGYLLENDIFWNGLFNSWEKNSLQLWSELCEESEVIFDVGANTGIYALLAKTITPNARVFAFEPVKRVFEKLEFNDKINDFNIECINKAASNYDGEATIYDSEAEHVYSVTVNQKSSSRIDSTPVKVTAVKLDTFVEDEKLKKVDLLKIDVETHEAEVLEGFQHYIEKFEPTLLIEVLNEGVARGIKEVIKNIDYLFYNIDEKKGINKVTEITQSKSYNFLICKPHVAKRLNI